MEEQFGPVKPPTLKHVAALAKVSVATASNVMSCKRDKYVSPELVSRVREAAKQLGYRPNVIARCMKGKRRNIVAILVPEFWNPVFTRMVTAAEQAAQEHGLLLLICSTLGDPKREEKHVANLMEQQVDGYLIAPSCENTKVISRLRSAELPFVVIDCPVERDQGYDYVTYDAKGAVIKAMEHLAANGHCRIGYIGWNSNRVMGRVDGFIHAVRGLGLSPEKCPVVLDSLSRETGLSAIKRLRERVTAVIVGHHHIAEGVTLGLREMGLRVPDDISMIVFGNPTWTEISGPGITAIRIPEAEIGRQGLLALANRIDGHESRLHRVTLECDLLIRGSVRDLRAK